MRWLLEARWLLAGEEALEGRVVISDEVAQR
jgi:hypothetical protein